jgi:phosphate starvation-inducible protein PhoH and related proteins
MKKNKKLRKENNENLNDENEDTSPKIYQRSKLKFELSIRKRNDLTENQNKFLELATDKNVKMMFLVGPAGTSKTFLTVLASLMLLNNKSVSDLIYLRSVVECSEKSMGFLPGTEEEKLSPYLQPLMDKLEELLSKNDIQFLLKEKRIQGKPINYLRGSHMAVKSIILDEAQNASYKELFTLVTRMGEFSKLFLIGDTQQSDIKNSGFESLIRKLDDEESRENGIFVFRFTEEDVVRSQLVKFLLKKLKQN